MRDRLIELMRQAEFAYLDFSKIYPCEKSLTDFTADYLLEKGVIVPPCKLGDTVWYISTENPHVAFEKELKPRTVKEPIEGILITKDGVYVNTYNFEEAKNYFDKVGEDYAYLTKEDAEAEIKRRERDRMYVKTEDVKEAIKKYFHDLIDIGKKEVDVVDGTLELQEVVDKVPGIGWIRVEDKLPPEGEVVLVIVDGKYGNIEFVDEIEMGSYYPEGWLLESYHKITDPDVSYWMYLPDGPENGEG